LAELGVDGTVILNKQGMKLWNGFIWLRIETSGKLLWTR